MAKSSKCRFARLWVAAAFLGVLLLSATLMQPVSAATDNANLVQQILDIVRRTESAVTGLTGLGGSLSTLQGDVTAIKSKTGNLPDDTADVLNEIRGNIGSPLTRMFMQTFVVGLGDTESMTCSSTGPYLLHVHGHGIHASISSTLNGAGVGYGSLPVPQYLVLGGNAGDEIQLTISVGTETNPNAFGYALVTMQTTEGAVISCNET
jgi:hypothetical protein